MNRTVVVAGLCLAGAVLAQDAKDVIDVAVASKDHTTLVAAVKAADLVVSLKNPGPFTVFAPTNAAFDKLPKGTVEGLVKPEKKADLSEILKYHVAVSIYQLKDLKDGQVMAMANGSHRQRSMSLRRSIAGRRSFLVTERGPWS